MTIVCPLYRYVYKWIHMFRYGHMYKRAYVYIFIYRNVRMRCFSLSSTGLNWLKKHHVKLTQYFISFCHDVLLCYKGLSVLRPHQCQGQFHLLKVKDNKLLNCAVFFLTLRQQSYKWILMLKTLYFNAYAYFLLFKTLKYYYSDSDKS